MKKGFTLVELLAVIVILAIIALIATPIILNIIKDSKEEANQRSVEMYAEALKEAITQYQLDGKKLEVDSLEVIEESNGRKFENTNFKVEYEGNVICEIIEIYEDGNIYLDKCEVNGSKEKYKYGKINLSINDDWSTIINNIKSGKVDLYRIGQTKELDLGTFGKHTVRIVNKSFPGECNNNEYSKTACGFVMEFEDILELKSINLAGTTNNDWKNSNLRKYINETIFNFFPQELKNNIINTKVITGSGDVNISNFETEDKLYLLSPKEIYGNEGISDDTARYLTRQLDYYRELGVTVSDTKAAIKKYNGNVFSWWLRTPYSFSNNYFYIVNSEGSWSSSDSINNNLGISLAFRIG